jgi:diguanylate cyclase (GGDEF)-like protein
MRFRSKNPFNGVSRGSRTSPCEDQWMYEDIGLSRKAGWYSALILNFVGGGLFMALWLAGSLPATLGLVGTAALLVSPFCLLGAKYFPYSHAGAHVRMVWGVSVVLVGAFLSGRNAALGAAALVIMLPLLSIASMQKPRISVPYFVVGLVGMTAILLLQTTDATALSVVTCVVVAAIGTVVIVTQQQLRQIAAINLQLAVEDSLTGAANRRRLHEQLRKAMADAALTGIDPVLYAIDLDNFKSVNDRFSHAVGDELLCASVDEMRAELAPGDLIARRGGDEFSVLAFQSPGRDLDDLSDRLSDALRRARRRVCDDPDAGGSVGYVVNDRAETPSEMLARADKSLHDAKILVHPERAESEQAAQVLHIGDRRGRADDRRRLATSATPADRDQIAEELAMARWLRKAMGPTAAWRTAAFLVATAAVTLPLLTIAGLTPDLGTSAGIAAMCGIVALAAICLIGEQREAPAWWIVPIVFALAALLTAVMQVADESRYALLSFYLLPLGCAFYCVRRRLAVALFLMCTGLFVYFVLSTGHQYAGTRIGVTLVATALMMAYMAKTRTSIWAHVHRAVENSIVDPLTGLVNIRGLRREVGDRIDRLQMSDTRVAVVAIDLDDFKSVNDLFDHSVGDALIVSVANALADAVRTGDVVARRGGDEFAVVCTIVDDDDVWRMVPRLGAAVARARRKQCPNLRPTASIAVVMSRHGEDADSLLERADLELLEAKKASRAEDGDERTERLQA